MYIENRIIRFTVSLLVSAIYILMILWVLTVADPRGNYNFQQTFSFLTNNPSSIVGLTAIWLLSVFYCWKHSIFAKKK